MYSKVLIQFLCLSLALVEIKAMVRLPENDNQVINDPEPNEEQEHRHRHHGGHHRHGKCHHHHRHHDDQDRIEPYPADSQSPPMPRPPPHQEMLRQILPLFQSLLNRDIHKTGKVDASSDQKMEAQSKTRAFVMSKIKTKYTETLIQNNKLSNDSKILTKVLETNGETNAVIDFNADMDVVSDKVLKAKTDEDSKPIEEKRDAEHGSLPRELPRVLRHPAKNLRRMKRSDDAAAEGKKTWDNIMGAFKKVGEAIKDGFKKHVEEPVKKFVENVKQKSKEWQKKKQGEKDQGQEEQQEEPAATEASEQHEEK